MLLTSGVGCTLGARRFGLTWSALGEASLRTLEAIGAGTIFFSANLAAGMMVIAAMRKLAGVFVSSYTLGDVGLLALSMLQGMVFAWWHNASEHTGWRRSEPLSRVRTPSVEQNGQ